MIESFKPKNNNLTEFESESNFDNLSTTHGQHLLTQRIIGCGIRPI